ncbi:zinc-ribbon domain-containing protein [bacterium]|nr:zinc-ribbon domain-containing protein [bacterium]
MSKTCDSCGARLSDGLDICDLCGTPREGVIDAVLDHSTEESEIQDPVVSEITGVFCNTCGWKNPQESNFCSKCGSALQAVSASDEPRGAKAKAKPVVAAKKEPVAQKSVADKHPESQKAVGRQIGIIVASALLVVLALYVVTTMSKAGTESSATSLPPALREKMAGLSGEELVAAQRELVDLYFAAGRFDLAAEETEVMAGSLNSENEWAIAGNLYYDWMERQDPSLRTPWARKAIAAYQEVLKINPANLDVRTDMAIAYMYDPQNSMMAIQETNAVLAQDSLHMQANFNRGIMLMQIDRTVQAAEQFQKVMELIGDPDDAVYIRAKELADRLKSEAAATNS